MSLLHTHGSQTPDEGACKDQPFHVSNNWDYIAKDMKQTGNSYVVVQGFH